MATASVPLFRGIDHLNLTVSSLDAAQAFYSELFDFQLVESGVWQGYDWRILRSADSMLCLYEGEPEAGGPFSHVGFRIADEAWVERLERSGVTLEYGQSFRRPHSTSWYIRDPDGNEIEVTLWDGDTISFEGVPV